jgi:hypothetical protein
MHLHLHPRRDRIGDAEGSRNVAAAGLLHFTAPNRDPGALDLMKRRLEASLANQAQSPGAVFGERVRRSTPWITTRLGR